MIFELQLKFMFSKKSKQNHEIFTVDLTFSKCKIEGEDFVIFVASLENMNFKGKQYH